MMRRIFRAINQSETVQAWIGNTAPIPAGWYLDPDSAKSAFNPNKGEESHAMRQEEIEGPEEVTLRLGHRPATDEEIVAMKAAGYSTPSAGYSTPAGYSLTEQVTTAASIIPPGDVPVMDTAPKRRGRPRKVV